MTRILILIVLALAGCTEAHDPATCAHSHYENGATLDRHGLMLVDDGTTPFVFDNVCSSEHWSKEVQATGCTRCVLAQLNGVVYCRPVQARDDLGSYRLAEMSRYVYFQKTAPIPRFAKMEP